MKPKPTVGERLIAETPAKRHRERELETATVTKVGRKYFSVILDGRRNEEEFFLDTWRRKGCNLHHNFPINLFRTRQEMEDRDEKNKLAKLLADNFSYRSEWEKVELPALRAVAHLLDIKP